MRRWLGRAYGSYNRVRTGDHPRDELARETIWNDERFTTPPPANLTRDDFLQWQQHTIKTIEAELEKYEDRIKRKRLSEWKHSITTSDKNMGK